MVNGGTASTDLYFSSLMTANLRLFANLGDVQALKGTEWTHGLRVVLAADNAFNEHQRVLDGTGAIPSAYQSAYLDPLGRVIRLDLRKLF
jgi:iron complex outermembrane recepter protein